MNSLTCSISAFI